MAVSACPVADQKEVVMTYTYVTKFFTLEMIDDRQLADLLESGWEMVTMVPFRMAPEAGSTVVKEYLATLRQPAGEK